MIPAADRPHAMGSLASPRLLALGESWLVQIVKILLYIGAFGCVQSYHPLATSVGFAAFAGAVVLATLIAQRAYRADMRSLAVLVLGLGGAALFHFLAWWVRESTSISMALGVDGTIYASDVADSMQRLLDALARDPDMLLKGHARSLE